jgi:RNase P/RNase MRP subunit p29
MNRLEKIELAIKKGITCNPETGEVFGVKGNKLLSKPTSTYSKMVLKENGKVYQLRFHIFIWYWANKEIVEMIDHIDGDIHNNRIENLRAVNNQQNMFNITKAKGYSEIPEHKRTGNKYIAKIRVDGRTKFLGRYKTESDARNAYLEAKKIYHKI